VIFVVDQDDDGWAARLYRVASNRAPYILELVCFERLAALCESLSWMDSDDECPVAP
jgi:hypothetical protein